MLTIRALHKGFRQGENSITLLSDLSLSLDEGKSLSVMGASGCGKSTLLNIIAGLLPADSGDVSFTSKDEIFNISQFNEAQSNRYRKLALGIVFQRYNLIDFISAQDNILLPARHKNSVDRHYIDYLIAELGLNNLLHKSPVHLSGGEQQRVAIARALAHKPALLLADEPTGNLDPTTSETVSELLYSVCKATDTTLLVVTHSEEVANKADFKGKIVNSHLFIDEQKNAE